MILCKHHLYIIPLSVSLVPCSLSFDTSSKYIHIYIFYWNIILHISNCKDYIKLLNTYLYTVLPKTTFHSVFISVCFSFISFLILRISFCKQYKCCSLNNSCLLSVVCPYCTSLVFTDCILSFTFTKSISIWKHIKMVLE